MSRVTINRLGQYVAVAFAVALFASCGGGDSATSVPAAPTQPPATQPPFRNLTGTWTGTDVELTGDRRTFELTIVFTQPAASSTLTGTLTQRIGGTDSSAPSHRVRRRISRSNSRLWSSPMTRIARPLNTGTPESLTTQVRRYTATAGSPSIGAGAARGACVDSGNVLALSLRSRRDVGPFPACLVLPPHGLAACTRARRFIAYSRPLMAATLAHAFPSDHLDSPGRRPSGHAATGRRSARARVVGWMRPTRIVTPSALSTAATRAIDNPRPRMSRTRPRMPCSGPRWERGEAPRLR